MSDVSNGEVLRAITDLSKQVETYHGDFREFRGATKVKVAVLEKSAADDKFWANVKVICVLPAITVLHQIAAHFGWIK